jgi:mannose-1-phosphate guanylyltransferase
MRAFLLSAGLGTRLHPVTKSIPKCLVNINGRPLIDIWVDTLSKNGISEILINLHYLPGLVRSHLSNSHYSANITTVFEKTLLGTGGSLLKNKDFFNNQPLMLVHADNLSIFDVHAFIERFQNRGKDIEITMMTFNATNPESCGIVEIDNKGIVKSFHEKVNNPPGNIANGAVYILAPSVIDFLISLGKEVIDFSTEVLPSYIGRINTFHNKTYHRDIGTVESLLAAQHEYPVAIAKL